MNIPFFPPYCSCRQRNRRPDREVYVPRGRRSQPAPPETAQNQSTVTSSPQSVSNINSSITESVNTIDLTNTEDRITSTLSATNTESVNTTELTRCRESDVKSVDHTKRVDSGKSADSTKLSESTTKHTTVTVKNKENTKNTVSSRYKEHTKSAESSKRTVAVKIADNSRNSDLANCIEPTKPLETTKVVDATKSVEATKRIESVNSAAPVMSSKHSTIAKIPCSDPNMQNNTNDTKTINERKSEKNQSKSVSPNPKVDTKLSNSVEKSLRMSDTHIKSDSDAMNTHDKDVSEDRELQRASKVSGKWSLHRRTRKKHINNLYLILYLSGNEPK